MILHAASIGDEAQIRQSTTFGVARTDHNFELPEIGPRADIGAGACVLGAIRVGEGAVIGANAVVLKDVPDGAVAVGVPAKVIKQRDPQAGGGDMNGSAGQPSVGVVAIGRNEGARLRGCLASLAGTGLPIVYVDSGSEDGSPELAAGLGAEVHRLDASRPFCASRARQEGAERLLASQADLQAIFFVDADCVVAEGWIDQAIEALDKDAKLGAVCGRRRERSPHASVYNLMCDHEWDTPIGAVPGGRWRRSLPCGGLSRSGRIQSQRCPPARSQSFASDCRDRRAGKSERHRRGDDPSPRRDYAA